MRRWTRKIVLNIPSYSVVVLLFIGSYVVNLIYAGNYTSKFPKLETNSPSLLGSRTFENFGRQSTEENTVQPITQDYTQPDKNESGFKNIPKRIRAENVFAVALCHENPDGDSSDVKGKTTQTIILMKSAVALSSVNLTFILISDSEQLYQTILNQLKRIFRDEDWQKLSFKFKKFVYPEGLLSMRQAFKPCATARLFIPKLLNYDSVIYLDTDLIFLRPPEHLWREFGQFRNEELVGMVQTRGWYNLQPFIKFPWYGDTGLNSGVMVMNLTRIDQFPGGWTETFLSVFDQYKDNLVTGDQDLVNIVFYYRPSLVRDLGCEWNFSGLFCLSGQVPCNRAQKVGVGLLHGNANTYYRWHLSVVRTYWKNYRMGSPLDSFWARLESKLEELDPTECPHVKNFALILTKFAIPGSNTDSLPQVNQFSSSSSKRVAIFISFIIILCYLLRLIFSFLRNRKFDVFLCGFLP